MRPFAAVCRNLLEDAGEKFAFLTTKLRLLREQEGATSVRNAQPVVVTPTYSRERLAELFGVARPSLSRTLGELAREGLIRLSGSGVEIPDARKLAHLLQDRGSTLRDAEAGSCGS